jgi:Ala-tRNA(Pro) deacylase
VAVVTVESPLTSQERQVYDRLAELGIQYERHEHPPVATVEEAAQHWSGIDAAHCKNLFLRNQKGTRHYLVIIRHSKKADLRAVADQIGDGKLSFASPERLMTHLGLTPGSVSPFGLINDREHAVRVVLDRDVKAAERVSFHPNINTRTLVIAAADFARFLEACGNRVQLVSV